MASKHRNVSPYQTPRRGLNRGFKRKVSDFQKPTQPKRNRQIKPTRLTDFSFQHHRQSNDLIGNKGWYNPKPWSNEFNSGVNNGNSVFENIKSNSSNTSYNKGYFTQNHHAQPRNMERNSNFVKDHTQLHSNYIFQQYLPEVVHSKSSAEQNTILQHLPNHGMPNTHATTLQNETTSVNNHLQPNEELNKLLLSLDPDLINLVASHKTALPPPDLLDKSSLKIRRRNIIDTLYNKEDKQCPNCGLRFSKDKKELFENHLDEHFRTKSELNKVRQRGDLKRRAWYPKFATIKSIMEERAIEENDNNKKEEVEEESVPMILIDNIVLAVNNDIIKCNMCQEEFDQIYIHDQDLSYSYNPKYAKLKEGWYLKNAAWSSTSEVIHPTCSN